MKISTKYNLKAVQVKYDNDGFLDFNQWSEIVTEAKNESIDIKNLVPESVDGSLEVTFIDGSILHIANPSQHSFCGYMIDLENLS